MKEQTKLSQYYFWGSLIIIDNINMHQYEAFILQGNNSRQESSIIQITGNNAGSVRGIVAQDVLGTVASTPEAIIMSISNNFSGINVKNIKITNHHISLSELFEIIKKSKKTLCAQKTINKSLKSNCKSYKAGTIFVVDDRYDGKCEKEAYMLAECNDENLYEIIQITGYHAGYGGFFIKRLKNNNTLTYNDLVNGIKFNFNEPNLKNLTIIESTIKIDDFMQVLYDFMY